MRLKRLVQRRFSTPLPFFSSHVELTSEVLFSKSSRTGCKACAGNWVFPEGLLESVSGGFFKILALESQMGPNDGPACKNFLLRFSYVCTLVLASSYSIYLTQPSREITWDASPWPHLTTHPFCSLAVEG